MRIKIYDVLKETGSPIFIETSSDYHSGMTGSSAENYKGELKLASLGIKIVIEKYAREENLPNSSRSSRDQRINNYVTIGGEEVGSYLYSNVFYRDSMSPAYDNEEDEVNYFRNFKINYNDLVKTAIAYAYFEKNVNKIVAGGLPARELIKLPKRKLADMYERKIYIEQTFEKVLNKLLAGEVVRMHVGHSYIQMVDDNEVQYLVDELLGKKSVNLDELFNETLSDSVEMKKSGIKPTKISIAKPFRPSIFTGKGDYIKHLDPSYCASRVK